MTTLYGLKNCDTCKKANQWLDRFGIPYVFVDYRENIPAPEMLVAWAKRSDGL